MLFRLTYISGGKLVGATFSAADLVAAISFAEMWEDWTGAPVLTMTALPPSRFNKKEKK